jgi:hypothetical protein
MTARIREFLRKRADDGPCLVVDLDVVRENYLAFAKALPDTKVFYAVKANPAPEVLALLAGLGSSFDTASVAEVEMVLAAGAKPDRISFGNTIKKERDVARAYALGVRLFAVDCARWKVARAALHARLCILSDCVGGWPRPQPAASLPWRSTCSSTPIGSASGLRHPFMSAPSAIRMRGTGRRLGGGRSASAAARPDAHHGQSRRRFRPASQERADGEDLRFQSSPRCGALRQPHPGDDHRAGPRHEWNAGIIEAEVAHLQESENDDVRWAISTSASSVWLRHGRSRSAIDPPRGMATSSPAFRRADATPPT